MQRILVIDDDRTVRVAVKVVLEREGFDVTVADDGRSGLAAIDAHAYDLIIVDILPGKITLACRLIIDAAPVALGGAITYVLHDASGSACARPSLIMTPDDPHHGPERGRVLPFQRRDQRPVRPSHSHDPMPVEDVGKYARGGTDDDDYRHRMKANAAALIVVVVLILCGIWIADTIAQMRKNQDCVLSGRRGCTPVQVSPTPRY